MACFWHQQTRTSIEIPTYIELSNVIYYKIIVNVGDVNWHVLRRYNEFFQLHSDLAADHGISKEILPSKKVIRNKCPIFLENRRKSLEEYLRKIFNYLKRTMPKVFIEFLNFHIYDIAFLLKNLAYKFFMEGDDILKTEKSMDLTPLELNAISEYLKQPFPMTENLDNRYDYTHVFDLCSQLEILTVTGMETPYKDSNIILNELNYELTSFQKLKLLNLNQINPEMIGGIGKLREILENLDLHDTQITSISQILQCDVLHKNNLDSSQIWHKLTHLDLSRNKITEIDETIKLLSNLETLILEENKITTIPDLSVLHKLCNLNLSNNRITQCIDLHRKLGNLKNLNLSQNLIKSLIGFQKLYSLELIDLSFNSIDNIEEISYLKGLPNLEYLLLTGNNVATIIDYRIKVLENFCERSKDICLDNEKPTQQEIDQVNVLKALRIVREGKTPNLINNFCT